MKTIADCLAVPIPSNLKNLPRSPNGFVIPFFAGQAGRGVERSQAIASPFAARQCNDEKICWICGQKLAQQVCFIGGPLSMQNRTCSDGPMHAACAEYSVRACPYIVIENFQRTAAKRYETQAADGAIDTKPERWGIAYTRDWAGYELAPRQPILFHWERNDKIRWFRFGEEIFQ